MPIDVQADTFERDRPEELSQASYRPTPYRDATWEVVGEIPEKEEFVPLELPVSGRSGTCDPMFADYGGIPGGQEVLRWHLPEGQAYISTEELEEREAESEPTTPLTDAEVEALKDAAFQEGKQAGIEEAVIHNADKMQEMSEKTQAVVEDLQQQFKENLEQVEKDCINLALEISKKIIDTAVEINPEYIVDIVRQAINMTGTAVIRAVRVSPQDLEFIELLGVARGIKEYDGSWSFVGDESVRNGCIVETSAGEVDFQLDPAWERIREKVVRIAR